MDISRLFFTCTNTSQAATCTYNTRSRGNPHDIVKSLITEEQLSTNPQMLLVFNLPLDECIDNTQW
jgi:hypothetical protein